MLREMGKSVSWGLVLSLLVLAACQQEDLAPAQSDSVGSGNSDILFIDPEPDPFTTAPWWGPVNIDIDQDSVTDIELRVLFAQDSTIPSPTALWGTQAACVNPNFQLSIGAFDPAYTPIQVGDTIGNSLTWWSTMTLHAQQPGGGMSGFWSYPAEGYIAIRRTQGDTINFGWVSVHTGLDNITYQNSAFQRIPDQVIHAGDSGD
jgi:hypothetical protein